MPPLSVSTFFIEAYNLSSGTEVGNRNIPVDTEGLAEAAEVAEGGIIGVSGRGGEYVLEAPVAAAGAGGVGAAAAAMTIVFDTATGAMSIRTGVVPPAPASPPSPASPASPADAADAADAANVADTGAGAQAPGVLPLPLVNANVSVAWYPSHDGGDGFTPSGGAVQVEPMKRMLKAPQTKRLKLYNDGTLSSFAFSFNLRR